MEETRSRSHGWGVGLPILVVDHDTTSLMFLASMLEQNSYRVTTTEVVSVAMSMILQRKDNFKLVMANIDMDDANSLSFLRILIKNDIRFILMSTETSKDIAKKAIAYGACFHLLKPVSSNDLKHLWQHVFRYEKPAVVGINDESTDDPKGKKKQTSETDELINYITTSKDEEEEEEDKGIKSKRGRPTDYEENEKTKNKKQKPRLIWKKELHRKFVAAFNALGDDGVRPKAILRLMNEPNLTLRQIASHLQKYKAQMGRSSEASNSNNLSSALTNISTSIYDQPGFYSMLGTYPGNTCAKFSIGDTNPYVNLPPQDSTAPMGSIYQNQQIPNVANGMQQMPSSIPNQSSISPNQCQVFMPSVQTTQGIDFVAKECAVRAPDVENSVTMTKNIFWNLEVDTTAHNTLTSRPIISENQNQQTADHLADLSNFLDEEEDKPRESGTEPLPDKVDQFSEWLKEAML